MRRFLMVLCVTLAVPGMVFAEEISGTAAPAVKSTTTAQPHARKPKVKKASKPAASKKTTKKKSTKTNGGSSSSQSTTGGKTGASY